MAPDAAASIASCHSTMSVRLSAAIQQESWTVERYRAKGSVLQPVAEGDESDGDLFLTASAKTLHELLWTFMEDVLPLHCRPTPDNSACCGLGLLLYSPVVNTMSSLLQTYVSELDATKEVAKDQTSAMLGAVADMSAIVEGLRDLGRRGKLGPSVRRNKKHARTSAKMATECCCCCWC